MNTSAKQREEPQRRSDETDDRLERLSTNLLPNTPYLMDLISPSRFHLPPHQANNWRRNCPFKENEEQLQYMTFLPHHVRGDTMLRTTGDWDDGEGRLKSERAKQGSGRSSGALSPAASQQPKKKISLIDYKNKIAGQNSGKSSPKTGSNDTSIAKAPIPRSEAISKREVKVDASLSSNINKDNGASNPPSIGSTHSKKRSADAMVESKDAKIFDIPPVQPPSKKVHTDREEDKAPAASTADNGNVHGLPRMLSPTLPANVEEQLAKLRGGDVQSTKTVNGSSVPESITKPAVDRKSVPALSKSRSTLQDQNGAKQTTEKGIHRKDQVLTQRPSTTDTASRRKEEILQDRNTKGVTSKTKTTTTQSPKVVATKPTGKAPSLNTSENVETVKSKQNKIVVFKIPKSLRKNCQRILQMQPRPRKVLGQSQLTPSSTPQDRSRERTLSAANANQQAQPAKTVDRDTNQRKAEVNSHSKAVATGDGTPNLSEKRRELDEDKDSSQPSSKRQRVSDAHLQKPSTPVRSSLKSPVLIQPGSNHKSQLFTPKNEFKSAAMRRVGSMEGIVRTPSGSVQSTTPIAPASTGRSHDPDEASSSNIPQSSTAAESNFYRSEFTKYKRTALSLKREADALGKLEDGQINSNPAARRQGLAKAIETTLCYMLAFTLKDESDRLKRLPSDRAPWISLLPYFRFLKSLIRYDGFAHLQGFIYHVEAVCHETILHHDSERLSREVAMPEQEAIALGTSIAQNNKSRQCAWSNGTRLLPMDIFQQQFPLTWARRIGTPDDIVEGEQVIPHLVPHRYGEGGFYLPLGPMCTTLETVRAGWSLLGEWCEQEGVQWQGKMDL